MNKFPKPLLAVVLCTPLQAQAGDIGPIDQAEQLPSDNLSTIEKRQRPALMLASLYHPETAPDAFWISEKFDGVRAYWDGKQLLSRQGYPIRAPAWFTKDFPSTPLDGELWIGPGQFEAVSAAARRFQPLEHEWRRIRYLLFDLPTSPQPYWQRRLQLQALTERQQIAHLRVPEYWRVTSQSALQQLLQQRLAAGAEGLMLNQSDALYQAGRSNALLKLKPYFDAEAMVLAHLPGKGKYSGMLGSLLVQNDQGVRFKIGTGFTDQQRRIPPAVGSRISYRYRSLTTQGKPRHASFLRPFEPL
ncbi:DNA ligase [Motiliproteus sp.]|uniref:DNA ligase n=1 Tax=Motiliproteus sp. TaxID=1898955 RepID=UPI003BAD3189